MTEVEKQARKALILLSEAISWARDQEITDRQASAIRRMNDAQDAIRDLLAFTEAIEADRAQREQPVHPDWQDDADTYRDAAAVDISWRAWDASGRQIGYSDASINGTQAAAMFEAIGRLEA